MGIYKRGDTYWYKFMWRGELIRESAKTGNDKTARKIEAAHRTRLAEGLVDIREKKPAPTLKEFLKNDFLPFAESKHETKPLTLRYYKQGCDMLTESALGRLRLDELTSQHGQDFARQHSSLSASGINRGLRTLRRSLNLAFQWGKLDRPLKVALAAGEHQRDRVLNEKEIENYLDACPQPWRDCATIILDEGFRPGEVFALQWPYVFLNEDGTGLIQVADGKSKAARRMLPITPRVYSMLQGRWEAAGRPLDGWVFPSTSRCGHFNSDAAKDQHKKALEDSGVSGFVPYTLRHTALTRLGEAAGGDVFVLARIAGHSSITITQRYVHPQADAISRVFAASQVGTKLGTVKKSGKKQALRTGERIALKQA
ncbi:MAG: site-specific integrase [Candidatus Sulfotelmatobacter sp.]